MKLTQTTGPNLEGRNEKEKEFGIMIAKMIKGLGNSMEKMQGSISKDLEELKNKHTEANYTIT